MVEIRFVEERVEGLYEQGHLRVALRAGTKAEVERAAEAALASAEPATSEMFRHVLAGDGGLLPAGAR
jgi:TPP-dependent pyruvate/acetoin dehydrogenase alpha subunit